MAVNSKSGDITWTTPDLPAENGTSYVRKALAVSDTAQLAYFIDKPTDEASQEQTPAILRALDVKSGKSVWDQRLPAEATRFSATVIGDRLFTSANDRTTTIQAWDASTGKSLWERDESTGAIIYDSGTALVTMEHGRGGASKTILSGRDAINGRPLWKYESKYYVEYVGTEDSQLLVEENEYGANKHATVALLKIDDRGKVGRTKFNTPITDRLEYDGDVMYALRADGRLRALDLETEEELWHRVIDANSQERPIATATHVYVRTVKSEIVALDPQTGRMLWRSAARADLNRDVSSDNPGEDESPEHAHWPKTTVSDGIVYTYSARDSLFAIAPPE